MVTIGGLNKYSQSDRRVGLGGGHTCTAARSILIVGGESFVFFISIVPGFVVSTDSGIKLSEKRWERMEVRYQGLDGSLALG